MNPSSVSPKVSTLVKILAGLLLALLIFAAGISVGYHKASFSSRWDDSYARQFGGPHSPFMFGDDGETPHGAFGEVVAVRLPSLIIKGPQEAEKTVIVGSSTAVRRFRDAATPTAIRTGDTVVVIGSPTDDGQIRAALIRIVPPPPSAGTSSAPAASPSAY